jgi:hypothetical protein
VILIDEKQIEENKSKREKKKIIYKCFFANL